MSNLISLARISIDKVAFDNKKTESERSLVTDSPQGRIPLLQDILLGAAIFLASLFFYTSLGLKLAAGQYVDYYNLAFDFDPYLYFSTMILDPANKVGFKHPLIVAIRPLSQMLLASGLSPKVAAVMTMCLFGAATNVLVWMFLRRQSIDRLQAFLLTVLFGISSTTVITSIVPESYGISNFAIVLTWLLALSYKQGTLTKKSLAWKYVSALLLAGATITNIVQTALAEFFVSWERSKWREAVKHTVRFGCKFAVLFIFAAFAVWHAEILEAWNDPLAAVRKVWWLQTKGETTGLLEIFRTFFVYSFVAPEFSTLAFSHDRAGHVVTRMLDFREWRFSGHGALAVALWLGGVVLGTYRAFRDRGNLKFYIGISAALLFNILFHTQFQFRGSLYLYAAHTHFLIFALFAGTAAPFDGQRWRRPLYIAALLGLIVMTGANNLPIFEAFANGFVQPATNCLAPCA